jgi:DNA-directed RNA polymerase subunit RPC12/RpoP
MSTITCRRCGEGFDPDRDPAVAGADTARCSSCGAKNQLKGDGGTTQTVTAPADVDEIEITVTIQFRDGGD